MARNKQWAIYREILHTDGRETIEKVADVGHWPLSVSKVRETLLTWACRLYGREGRDFRIVQKPWLVPFAAQSNIAPDCLTVK